MSILKDESIFKEYYDLRKEVHDQEAFENNKELHNIEENVAKCEDNILDFCKKYIKDENDLEELNKKFSKYELAFAKEIETWCENHFEWGLETMAKAKKEIKFANDDKIFDNNNEDIFFDFTTSDFEDYVEKNKDLTSEQYKKLRKKYKEIINRYPKLLTIMEDLEPVSLNDEEINALVELRKIDIDMGYLEEKLCFKLGMQEILNF